MTYIAGYCAGFENGHSDDRCDAHAVETLVSILIKRKKKTEEREKRKEERGRTNNTPKPKMATKPIFWLRGNFRPAIRGIGRNRITRSLKMLSEALKYQNLTKLKHLPGTA